MSDSAFTSTRNAAILEQLSYLIDELEAQRPWITRIPAFQLTGKPMDSIPSLLEMYIQMSAAEWSDYLPSVGINEARELDPSIEISDVIDRIQQGRTRLVEHLGSIPEEAWEKTSLDSGSTLVDFAYQITQSDGTFLRSIAERLHESMITFSK